jgi:hypothetical protein
MQMPGNDSIDIIEGKELDGFYLQLGNVTPGRFTEETKFECYLRTIDGKTSRNPVVQGRLFSGRGGFYRPWIEIYYFEHAAFESSTVDLSETGLDKKLFAALSSLLPPGAHFMVVYQNHEETREGLEHGFPASTTPIGYLLWKSGCTWFKDWYFAEGFREGDVKLQGNKPLNEQNRRNNLLEARRELADFLKKDMEDRIFQEARRRAKELLDSIDRELSVRPRHSDR